MKQNTVTAAPGGLAEAPHAVALTVRYNAPSAFREQERFWNEVRRRIVARRPEAAESPERLY